MRPSCVGTPCDGSPVLFQLMGVDTMSDFTEPHGSATPKGRALAVTALVIAIVSLLLCWIPIVNNVVFFLGVVGLIVAVIALVRARKGKAAGRTMSAAAIGLSALSLVGVIATQAFYVSVLDDVGDSITDAADGEVATSDSEKKSEAKAKVHALGESAKLGDFTVSIDQVVPNANAQLAKFNEFNSPPEGQFVLTTVTVTYNGDEESDLWLDLSVKLAGSDSRTYDTSSCDAVVPKSINDVPTLNGGGKATGSVCFDVPAAAIAGSKILVEESLSFSDKRVYWSIAG